MANLVTESKSYGATETLQRLLNVNDDDYSSEEEIPPTAHAVKTASQLLREANRKIKTNFPCGSVSTDDVGGIRIQWQGQNREVRLIIAALPEGRSYIYHEQGDDYGKEREVTSENLAHWLDHLPDKPELYGWSDEKSPLLMRLAANRRK
jgi:hypothetical protein